MTRHAPYTPTSALSGVEKARYMRLLSMKRAQYPAIYNSAAGREGLKQRVIREIREDECGECGSRPVRNCGCIEEAMS